MIYPQKVNMSFNIKENEIQDNTKQRLFYQYLDLPTMLHYAKYNSTFTKSEFENYNENIFSESLNQYFLSLILKI